MDLNKQRISCKEIKDWDMIPFLSRLGYEPARVRHTDYWYRSPLRTENTPSFKVNRNINKWFDHGIGQGGNLVDFCLLYYGCGIAELLSKYDTGFSFHQQPFIPLAIREKTSKITIIGDFTLTSFRLFQYLESRCINPEIALLFCREIRFRIDSKIYYAIGFENDIGGYELRNSFFKGSSSPKGITTFRNGANSDKISVFEGFFSFLSYLCSGWDDLLHSDFLILNSLAFFEKSLPIMDAYKQVLLFLDNDKAGQNCSSHALSLNQRYQNRSNLYAGFKDVNQWLVNQPVKTKPM